MIFLIGHNIEGQAMLLFGTLTAGGWLDTLPIRFVFFGDVDLPIDSSDRVVWRFAQDHKMLLLTANRSMKGEDSLEQALREEMQGTSLPVITIANVDQIAERDYRERCVEQLIETVIYLENYLGVNRLFIP